MTVASKFITDSSRFLHITEKTLSKSALTLASGLYIYKIIYPKLAATYKEYKIYEQKLLIENTNNRMNSISKISPKVDKKFFHQLLTLLRVIFPSLWSKPSLLLCVHTITLVIRTFLSIYVAKLEGKLVKYIVSKNVSKFGMMMATWICLALPATFVNSSIRFLEAHVALAIRSKLTTHFYKLYFKNQCYYRISNLDGRLKNADHCLTDDIATFSHSLAHLYSHITKPILDAVLISLSLISLAKARGGASAPGSILAGLAITITGRILKLVSPNFGKLVSEEQNQKGHLRFMHSRIVTNAEEIAFYGGHKIELRNLENAYQALCNQIKYILNKKLWYIMIEQFLVKYVWSATGMVMLSIPLLTTKRKENNDPNIISERTEYLTTARKMLLNGSDAVERLMTSYKEIIELSGYTVRVGNMLKVFEDVQDEKYVRSSIRESRTNGFVNGSVTFKNGKPHIIGEVYDSHDGTIVVQDVPIITPNGDMVVPSMNLRVTPNMHLLITGPNGCGKSSLFRILGSLWPVYRGKLWKPPASEMFYIPQRPYMTVGTLRDQVIYPDTVTDMEDKGITDRDLGRILSVVHLNNIVEREGGWDANQDWKDVLSGGEKQRMGMARLFYKKPRYALLDECTSAVSIDVEGQIYQAVKDAGITLLTITHRPSLWKFHTHILQMDGEGGWKLDPLDSDKRLGLKDEKLHLENVLSDIPNKMDRLRELCQILGENSSLIEVLEESSEKKKSICEENLSD